MPEDSSAVAAATDSRPEIHVDAMSHSVNSPDNVAGPDFTDSFADLEKAMGGDEPSQEAAKPTPKLKAAPAKVADRKSPESSTKTGSLETSAKDATTTTKESSEENGKPLPAPELRKAYQDLKAKHAEREAKYAALEKEYSAFKSNPREHPDYKSLNEKLQTEARQRTALEERLRDVAFEQTDEFKRTYHEPFIRAYERGQQLAQQFKVTDAEGNQRQGSPDDFAALMQIADEDAATKWAEDTYGPTRAAILMQQRNEVVRSAIAKNGALSEAQKTRGEREKAHQAQQRALSDKWEKLNASIPEKYPKLFKEIEGDTRGNELLKKGMEFASKAFNGSKMSPEEAVDVHHALYLRAGAFSREAYLRKQAESRVAELEAELAEFQKSTPSKGEGKSEPTEGGAEDWERNLDAHWNA